MEHVNDFADLITSFFFLCVEILRVSGMLPSQGFGDFDRRQHRSPSPMASANLVSNVHGGGYGGWNGLNQEVFCYLISSLLCFSSRIMIAFVGVCLERMFI